MELTTSWFSSNGPLLGSFGRVLFKDFPCPGVHRVYDWFRCYRLVLLLLPVSFDLLTLPLPNTVWNVQSLSLHIE